MLNQSPISNFMTPNPVRISADSCLETIHLVFRQFPHLSFLPVEENDEFVGVIYRHDFLQVYLFQEALEQSAKDLTSSDVIFLNPDNPITAATEIFDTGVYEQIPIVDYNNQLVGMLKEENLFLPIGYKERTAIANWQ